jgi:hypothetical protein
MNLILISTRRLENEQDDLFKYDKCEINKYYSQVEENEIDLYHIKGTNIFARHHINKEDIEENESLTFIKEFYTQVCEKNKMEKSKINRIIILLHDKDIQCNGKYDIELSNNDIIKPKKIREELKIIDSTDLFISPFVHEVYSDIFRLISSFPWSQIEKSQDIENKIIVLCEKISYEGQKKKLINLWMPLAIDILGLSEVEEEKRKNYYNEIKTELTIPEGKENDYCLSLKYFPKNTEFPGWEDIKSGLDPKYKDFDPTKLVVEIYDKDYNSFNKEFFNRDKPNFLPKWLQEVINKIDKEINARK